MATFKGPRYSSSPSKAWYQKGAKNVGRGGGDGGDAYAMFHNLKDASPSLRSKSDANGKVIEAQESFVAGWHDKKDALRGVNPNPTVKRGRWFSAKVRVTKSGKIQVKVPKSAIKKK
jgi:hypothetical protein